MCNNDKPLNKEQKELNKIVKTCFKTAFWCILGLTILAGICLILNLCMQKTSYTLTNSASISCAPDSNGVQPKFDITHFRDTIGMAAIKVDEHKYPNVGVNETKSTDFLDSIIYNLTLAVNAVNNVLTSGSILVAILTLFIALIGLFAYHDLKTDVREELNKINTSINQNLDKTERNIVEYKSEINDKIKDTQDKQDSNNKDSIKKFETFKNEINNKILEAQSQQMSSIEEFNEKIKDYQNEITHKIKRIESFNIYMVAQSRFFNKSIDFLSNVSSTLTEKLDDEILRDMLFHDFYINTLYRYDFNPESDESMAILHHKKAAIEFLKDKGTKNDINDLEIIAQNEPNEEIKRKILELIGIIKHKFEK